MIRFFSALTLGFAMLTSGVAQAQHPAPPAPNPQPIQRVLVLRGTENLANYNNLMFTISGEAVEMIDASQRPISGTASIVGNRVTLTFGDCVYQGNLVNGVINGTARFTSGQNEGMTWNFNVRTVAN